MRERAEATEPRLSVLWPRQRLPALMRKILPDAPRSTLPPYVPKLIAQSLGKSVQTTCAPRHTRGSRCKCASEAFPVAPGTALPRYVPKRTVGALRKDIEPTIAPRNR